jgi:hypothetical protein
LNIRKSGKRKHHRDKKTSGVFFAVAKKMPDVPLCTENGEMSFSPGGIPPMASIAKEMTTH